jgi:hypothetical protein
MTEDERTFITETLEPAMRNGHMMLFWSMLKDASAEKDWDRVQALRAAQRRVMGWPEDAPHPVPAPKKPWWRFW